MSDVAFLRVCVVADNPETIDGLHAYLSRAGVSLLSSRRLPEPGSPQLQAHAFVFFPDEFRLGSVLEMLGALRAAQPRLPILLVTSTPQRFVSVSKPDGGSLPPIVLPKPAFGRTILDAIRRHAARDGS